MDHPAEWDRPAVHQADPMVRRVVVTVIIEDPAAARAVRPGGNGIGRLRLSSHLTLNGENKEFSPFFHARGCGKNPTSQQNPPFPKCWNDATLPAASELGLMGGTWSGSGDREKLADCVPDRPKDFSR